MHDRHLTPLSEFSACPEYDIQPAPTPGPLDHVNGLVEPGCRFVEVPLTDTGERQVAEYEGLRLRAVPQGLDRLFQDRLGALGVVEEEITRTGQPPELCGREEIDRGVSRLDLIELRLGTGQCLFAGPTLPGIVVPRLGADRRSSWYGLILHYRNEELGGLPIGRFYEALHAEGCHDVDRPGSTCPLNLLPLFQEPGPLFPQFHGRFAYARGDFPRAEEFHGGILKLPVWNREEDMPLVDRYIEAFRKVADNYRDLLG
ncbi:MAG: hypothetical protein JO115_25035 [Pseudonocardiales bacterium]|nr:hypothetical protein [Pseudonocardiales bacterium]